MGFQKAVYLGGVVYYIYLPNLYHSFQKWSFLARPSAGRSVTASILRQSEHINFFLPETFLRIANNLGTECKVQVSYIPTPDRKTIRVLQVLLQRK